MPTVPDTRIGKIEFYESHLDPWLAAGGAIGLSTGSITAQADRVAAARAAYDAHLAAEAAARAGIAVRSIEAASTTPAATTSEHDARD